MPRHAGASIPKYRKHRASGQAIVTIAGQDCYLGPHGTAASRREYDRLIGEWVVAGRPLAVVAAPDLTIAELVKRYKAFAEAYYASGGALSTIASTCKRLRKLYGPTAAAEFGPSALKAFRQHLVEKKRRLSRTGVNRRIDLIRRMFKWAASEQLVPTPTWQALQTVSGLRRGHTEAPENEPIKPEDDALVNSILPYLSATVSAMVRLQRLTGMRPDEVCRLRPCEADRSGDVWRFAPAEHKTAHHGRTRVVFIGPKGLDILRPFLLRDATAFCFAPTEAVESMRERRRFERQTPLGYGNREGTNRRKKPKRLPGDRYTANSFRRAIHRACDAADAQAHRDDRTVKAEERIIPRWSPNRLRHTAATEIRRQFGLEAAQVVLGHAAADVTQVYAELDSRLAADVASKIG